MRRRRRVVQLFQQEFYFHAGGCGDHGCHWLQVIGLPEGARGKIKQHTRGEGMPISAPAIVSGCFVWLRLAVLREGEALKARIKGGPSHFPP